jgi:DNA-directed RNA polymerase beta' subunit
VVKVDSNKINGPNSVYDPRLGTLEYDKICETCKEGYQICPGHFGHIELNEPIIHPLYLKNVVDLLNLICVKCFRFIWSDEKIKLHRLNKVFGSVRYKKLIGILKKQTNLSICCHCREPQPKYKYNQIDGSISMMHKDKKNKVSIILETHEIKRMFEGIPDEDVELLGFTTDVFHPKNLILTVWPVIPSSSRPYIIVDDKYGDDDLTLHLHDMVKINNLLSEENRKNLPESKIQKNIQNLKFKIATYCNNSACKATHSKGKPIKGIKERLQGKGALIRNSLSGKRGDGTARTVIGPDPTLKMGELAVPIEIAKNLTIPERVTVFNITHLQELVDSGKANFVLTKNETIKINLEHALTEKGTPLLRDDVIYRTMKDTEGEFKILVKTGREILKDGDKILRDGKFLSNVKPKGVKKYIIKVGDVVERQLRNGDIVLLNRQPTLHKASMQGMKIVIREGKTFRFNLSITKGYNADFDGELVFEFISRRQQGA